MKLFGNDLMYSRSIMKIFSNILVCSRDILRYSVMILCIREL
jgi:hypothetical protein